MIEQFEDANIVTDLTLEEGGPIEFVSIEGGLVKGYSLYVSSEESGDIFELLLSEAELKEMLAEIKEQL